MEELKIITPAIKLDQLVKYAGFSETGAKAKILIDLGEFNVNGDLCTKRGKKIKPGDIIEYNNVKYKVVFDEEGAAAAAAEEEAKNAGTETPKATDAAKTSKKK